MKRKIQEDKHSKPMPLERWQNRLDKHFAALMMKREGSGLPLFAFEHCLTVEEIEQISELLRERLTTGKRLGIYWLLWVVYAAEIGYHYTGDEYWQSFEEQTPGWEFHHRYLLGDWFRKFQKRYHGFVPTGPWAEHFSIIAWPITHAILPKYLQYQFASALYQQRYRLAGLKTLDSLSVGRLLATHTDHATTRFEIFLQQEELTGRIVLALLDQFPEGGHEPIYPKTLDRIVTDLDDVRRTSRWLRDTRQTITDRIKGIGQGAGRSVKAVRTFTGGDRHSYKVDHPDIRPNILLRYSGSGKWAVAIEVPNFASVAALHPDLRAFLKRTRCRLSGGSDTKPAGWTLSGNRIGIIKFWPDEDEPLLRFEKSNDAINRLLQTDCRLSSGPNWLFRISTDGRARECRGLNVHTGAAYIFVSTQEHDTPDNSIFSACTLECDGVYAVRIAIPESLTGEKIKQLKNLGLGLTKRIRVWPVGLPCRGWDGEGQSEWLTTECPQFGILHDHPVQSYLVRLDEEIQISIDAPDLGKPVFIKLDPLSAGKHRVTITAQRLTSTKLDEESLTGYVDLNIREPEPWIPGVPAHTGLIVNLEPYDADLDEFWSNSVALSINGPENHSISCVLSLGSSNGERIFCEQIGQTLDLPVSTTTWEKQFDRFLKEHEEAGWDYLEASSGTLTIKAGELGQYCLRFDRIVSPVRWITRRRHGQVQLRLVDDTGLVTNAMCKYFSMDHPAKSELHEVTKLLTGVSPAPPGGLYIATHENHNDAIIVSNFADDTGLQALGVNPDFTDMENGSVSVPKAIRIMEYWMNARLVGSIVEYRRNQILKRLHSTLYLKLCGENWANAELMFINKPTENKNKDRLYYKILGKSSGFSSVLERDREIFNGDIIRACNWYANLVSRYGLHTDNKLCEFSVRLACVPHTLSKISNSELSELVQSSHSSPSVLKGVRYAALLLTYIDSCDLTRGDRERI
ncbi:MAG: hypothetical protein KME67_11160 [Candidatus Thiodiazotropha sp. (ex Codakia orbicularis)]|nr:hypothetical protein [Candidatus Thiodiazotropha sp. (ex Codakia orbicularis)]